MVGKGKYVYGRGKASDGDAYYYKQYYDKDGKKGKRSIISRDRYKAARSRMLKKGRRTVPSRVTPRRRGRRPGMRRRRSVSRRRTV